MCYNHLYPTTLALETKNGKSVQRYQPGPCIDEFGRQEQLNANTPSQPIAGRPGSGSLCGRCSQCSHVRRNALMIPIKNDIKSHESKAY